MGCDGLMSRNKTGRPDAARAASVARDLWTATPPNDSTHGPNDPGIDNLGTGKTIADVTIDNHCLVETGRDTQLPQARPPSKSKAGHAIVNFARTVSPPFYLHTKGLRKKCSPLDVSSMYATKRPSGMRRRSLTAAAADRSTQYPAPASSLPS
ncbi:hypothetical protein EVAR_91403_1 [Eumeta japonica]|uniref:Uncharacterized protein n=1 Tax=Eumeta variegata TaxID=151549 RepID=A0A4C1XDM3_EUMVA|nr:hypothetical protein EVAR_91403_1 [Eumeta japonica]